MEFCSVNRIVLADVDIVSILVDRKIGAVRNIAEGLIFTGCNGVGLTVFLGFFPCFLCPLAGNDIICHTMLHQVLRNGRKLQMSAAL